MSSYIELVLAYSETTGKAYDLFLYDRHPTDCNDVIAGLIIYGDGLVRKGQMTEDIGRRLDRAISALRRIINEYNVNKFVAVY